MDLSDATTRKWTGTVAQTKGAGPDRRTEIWTDGPGEAQEVRSDGRWSVLNPDGNGDAEVQQILSHARPELEEVRRQLSRDRIRECPKTATEVADGMRRPQRETKHWKRFCEQQAGATVTSGTYWSDDPVIRQAGGREYTLASESPSALQRAGLALVEALDGARRRCGSWSTLNTGSTVARSLSNWEGAAKSSERACC